ncbi:MAG TPA: allophanate hydrolase [Acidimicrobiales bacterium]|nr:allophanate hydrolase [Acidimicrobiales bacterium]
MSPTGPLASRVADLPARIDRAERDEVWIDRVPATDLRAAAEEIDRRVAAGEVLPLAGLTFAVKDNIDVAGVPTTAGCPAYAYRPETSAPAVQALLEAGALLVGKTNLDQFATGLVGARSPYGPVRNAVAPEYISGGSSSGSAVAVALGLVDFALGTDTAGSGRVPAALNGIVGLKPTRGLVSTTGVVPASRSCDCVSVLSATLSLGERVLAVMAGPDPDDARSRDIPPTAPLGLPDRPVVAYADPDILDDLDPGRRRGYQEAVGKLESAGCSTVAVGIDAFLEAGQLLYRGGFVAERYVSVGEWVDAHPEEVDPVVGPIVAAAGTLPATQLASDIERVAGLKREAETVLAEVGAISLLLPTAPFHPTIAEVGADPVGVNSRLGRYTTFVNLLDMCAVSVPAGMVDGLPFGVSFIGPAWSDLIQADLARKLEPPDPDAPLDNLAVAAIGPDRGRLAPPAVSLAVVGAHLTGQPLNHQLTDRGARRTGVTTTSADYHLYALATDPPKPGLVRVATGGSPIEVEVWELPPVGFAEFVAALPPPMVMGSVRLMDGTGVVGFLCEPIAIDGAEDITAYGGWRAYLADR